ncbi:uncharacterized protein OCT59_016606 [Rhizophagus irregularis]|uniref:uncharacterized protein n=1 Tax=Rhizophagus irregularis TaxID=588596 RepID=UPI00331BF31C|nr:hypothetical protein OCT59_016606 [Rhizophagus irregularis]
MELGDPFENEQRIGNFILLPYREIKEKKEKEKEEEHWILSWRPEFLRMEIDGAMIPVATPWDGMAVSTFKQLAKWIMILEPMPMKIQPWPTVLNAAKQGCQKSNNKVSGESRFRESSSLSSGRSWEFGKESSTLAVRELCRNEYMVPSSVTDTRVTNQNLCDNNKKSKTDSVLRELQNDHETQNTHDLASLIRLLKDKEPYRDETNKDVLFDYEIQFFAETYGITDFLLMLHVENLCYADEITRKLVPINAYDKEAEELVKPPEACNNIDVTKNTLFANLYKSAVQEANLSAEMPLQ